MLWPPAAVLPGTGRPLTALVDRKDMADKRDPAESNEPIEAVEATEKADRKEPTEPIDSAEPTEPIERTEPLDAIDNTEPSDHNDQSDPGPVLPLIPWPHPRPPLHLPVIALSPNDRTQGGFNTTKVGFVIVVTVRQLETGGPQDRAQGLVLVASELEQ